MHPRTILRNEVVALMRETLPDAYVAQGRARDLPPGTKTSVLIYTPSESVRQPDSGDGSPDRPFERTISLDVVLETTVSGDDGSQALDRADELSRRIEDAINGAWSHFTLNSTQSGVSADKDATAGVVLSYSVDIFDGA